jgi:tetratricopeptide (TPR) repeat protein
VYLEDPKHAYADEQTLVDLGVEPASHLNLPDWQSQKQLSDLDPAAKTELEKLNQAIAKDPTAANYAVRALFYRKHYMSSEAIADDSRAIELNPNAAFNWMSRGGDRCQLGLYMEGLPDLNKALSLATYGDRTYIRTLNARLDCYLHLGEKKGAYADLQTLVKLGAGKAKYLNEPCLH